MKRSHRVSIATLNVTHWRVLLRCCVAPLFIWKAVWDDWNLQTTRKAQRNALIATAVIGPDLCLEFVKLAGAIKMAVWRRTKRRYGMTYGGALDTDAVDNLCKTLNWKMGEVVNAVSLHDDRDAGRPLPKRRRNKTARVQAACAAGTEKKADRQRRSARASR